MQNFNKFCVPTKVIVMGDSGVGKTCMLQCLKEFQQNGKKVLTKPVASTIGVNFVRLMKGDVALNVWDTAGAERFRSISKCYARGANLCLLAFDTLNSLHNCINWAALLRETSPDCKVILVRTKQDIISPAFDEDLEVVMNKTGAFGLTAVSCVTGSGVEELFETLFEVGPQSRPQEHDMKIVPSERQFRWCC